MAFYYNEAIQTLCKDICLRVPEFNNIKVEQIGFNTRVSRNKSRVGVWASVTPLRFENGSPVQVRTVSRLDPLTRRRVTQRLYFTTSHMPRRNGQALLYLFTIMAPRFIDELDYKEKLLTIMHELYHIDPRFNGDVRRFPGKNWKHGSHGLFEKASQRFYDIWLATDPPECVFDFLKYNSAELKHRYAQVAYHSFRGIRLKPITEAEAFALDPNLQARYGHK